jgi:hypothetical protein
MRLADRSDAVRIEYGKDSSETDKFLMSRNVAYKSEDDLCFAWNFTDWARDNLKNWDYEEHNSTIELIFEDAADAVYFKIAWMSSDEKRGSER